MRYGLPFGVAASLVEYGYVLLLSVLLQGDSALDDRFFYLTILQFLAFVILAFLTGLLPARRSGLVASSLVAGGAFMIAFLVAITAIFTIDAFVLRMTGGVPAEDPVLLTAVSGLVLGGVAFFVFVIPTFIIVSLSGLVGRALYRRRVRALSR
jgi:hypothetical protein